MPETKDVFILGTAYCGSTLLGNALNAHSQIAYAGEVSRLPAYGIGEAEHVCPLCASQGRPCPVWSPALIAEFQSRGPGDAFEVYRESVGGMPVVVDGSKHTEWFRKVLAAGPRPRTPFVLITARSPFSFLDSCRRREGYSPWLAANIWRDTMFDIFRTVALHNVPHLIVRYEDFALDPQASLSRVCDFLSLDFEAGMLEFWNEPLHALGGNAGALVWFNSFRKGGTYASQADAEVANAYATRQFGGWSDEKWIKNLGYEDISAVTQTPLLPGLCSLIGYNLYDLLKKTAYETAPQGSGSPPLPASDNA